MIDAARRGWNQRLRDLFSTPQVKRILGIALGAASAQAALLLASPVLTRLFTPADFGVYSYFFATLGFLAPVATLRYELAIPIPTTERDARNVALSSMGAALLVGAIVATCVGVGWVVGIPGLAEASLAFLVGLPVGVLAAGVYQTLTYWAVRQEHFRSITIGRATLGGGTSVAQIVLGIPALGAFGLILGDLSGRVSAVLVMLRDLRGTVERASFTISPDQILGQARRYRGFVLFSCPSALMNSLALFLPLFAVGWIYGAEAAGWLFLAQRVIGLPATLLTSATSQVYIAEFTKTKAEARPALYNRTVGRVAALSLLPFLGGALAAPHVFPFLFGAEWATAGTLGMILAPYYFFQLLSGGTVTTLDTLELHGARMVREAGLLLVTLGVFALPAVTAAEPDLEILIGLFSLVGSIFYVGSLLFVKVLLPRESA